MTELATHLAAYLAGAIVGWYAGKLRERRHSNKLREQAARVTRELTREAVAAKGEGS